MFVAVVGHELARWVLLPMQAAVILSVGWQVFRFSRRERWLSEAQLPLAAGLLLLLSGAAGLALFAWNLRGNAPAAVEPAVRARAQALQENRIMAQGSQGVSSGTD